MDCFMYPGQPLDRSGDLPADDQFVAIASLVREIASFDLFTNSWLGEQGTEHVALQLYGVAMSIYLDRQKRSLGVQPSVIAEHSMGIYPALVGCGSLPEAEALEITWRVGACLAKMSHTASFAFGCIIGLTEVPVLSIAENHGVHLANHNTSRHFLLCGKKGNIELAVAQALAHGAFSAKTIACDAPLHTPLIAELEGELRSIFADYRYGEPLVPLVDHLEQKRLQAGGLADFMFRQLCRPVYWEKTYRTLVAMGIKRFHEIGAGDALKKYNRWIAGEMDQP